MGVTFTLTVLAWVFFRAENIGHAWSYLSEIFSRSLFSSPYYPGIGLTIPTIFLTMVFILVEWIGKEDKYALEKFGLKWKSPLRYAMYYSIIIAVFWFGGKEQQFIYFQF